MAEIAVALPLSDKQQRILAYIERYIEAHKYAPSIREITAACGISSSSVTNHNLNVLQRRGLRVQQFDERSRAYPIRAPVFARHAGNGLVDNCSLAGRKSAALSSWIALAIPIASRFRCRTLHSVMVVIGGGVAVVDKVRPIDSKGRVAPVDKVKSLWITFDRSSHRSGI